MRVLLILLATTGVASAEPSWAVGVRTTWNAEMSPPHMFMTGGQWGIRVGDRTWLMLEADGMREDASAAQWRSLIAFNMAFSFDAVSFGGTALAVHSGVGVGWEAAHMGDDIESSTARALTFAGIALERHFAVGAVERGTIGIELRDVYLFGEGPMSGAPPLARMSLQGTLAVTDYF